MAASARGELKLQVDELGLEAVFRFIPDATGGASWNTDSLVRILSEARVPSPPVASLEKAVDAFSRAKAPILVTVAKGHPPIPGSPESVQWEPPEAEAEYDAFRDRLCAQAGPPQLFTVRIERIAREKVITKPAALPFLPPKRETVTEYEKREVRDAVQVNPAVRASFWSPAGKLLGKIQPARPGKPGINLFGKPIPAPVEDRPFALGQGLSRSKGEVLCERAGFVRYGDGWADLVPFDAHQWSVRLSTDGATALLDFRPGHTQLPAPDAQAILTQASELGATPDSMTDAASLGTVLADAIGRGKALENFSLSLDRDAQVLLVVSEDQQLATLSLQKGRGRGKQLQLADVSRALSEAKLKGLKTDKFKADVLAFYNGPDSELRDYILVEGRLPAKGKDRTLGFKPSFMDPDDAKAALAALSSRQGLQASVPSLGEFPLSAVELVARVKKGDELARLSPPIPGQAGVDVHGMALPGLPGDEPELFLYENVERDGDSCMSTVDGLLLAASADRSARMRVLEAKDAIAVVRVSEDRMKAWLSLEAPIGLGRPLDASLVNEAMAKAGVVYGVDPGSIADALGKAASSSSIKDHPLADGTPPVTAGGWKLTWITRLASGAALTLRSDGSADFKNQDKATLVSPGQLILSMVLIGQEGKDGKDVLGQTIPAPRAPGTVEPPQWDASITEEKRENGELLLVAAKGGELKFDKNRLSVDTSQKVNGDVGPATGNLRFPGPVMVSGSILTGFAVIAGGDLLVGGSIEASLASAEGSVRVVEGIKGAKKGTVRAKAGIEASFAEQAMLLAVGDIVLKSSALMCSIKTNGKLVLQGEKGNLVGGVCRARLGAELQNIGSETSSRTEFSFGQDYLVKDAIEVEEREVERIKALILQADKDMKAAREDLVAEARARKVKLLKLLEKRSLRLFELRERFEEHHPGELIVRGTAFPGLCLESHGRTLELRAKKTRVAFSFDPQLGHITERPLK